LYIVIEILLKCILYNTAFHCILRVDKVTAIKTVCSFLAHPIN